VITSPNCSDHAWENAGENCTFVWGASSKQVKAKERKKNEQRKKWKKENGRIKQAWRKTNSKRNRKRKWKNKTGFEWRKSILTQTLIPR
jgi:glucan phosphorylase